MHGIIHIHTKEQSEAGHQYVTASFVGATDIFEMYPEYPELLEKLEIGEQYDVTWRLRSEKGKKRIHTVIWILEVF